MLLHVLPRNRMASILTSMRGLVEKSAPETMRLTVLRVDGPRMVFSVGDAAHWKLWCGLVICCQLL
jgi:hypothetical protein